MLKAFVSGRAGPGGLRLAPDSPGPGISEEDKLEPLGTGLCFSVPDPAPCSLHLAHRSQDREVASFFPEEGWDHSYVPLHPQGLKLSGISIKD